MADTEYIPTEDHRTDEDLVLAIATGDPTAVAELWARYRHSMRAAAGAALNLRGRADDVDDVVQETFVAIMSGKAEGFEPGRAPVGAWLYSMAHHLGRHLGNTSHHSDRILRTVELTEDVWTAIELFIADDPLTGNADHLESVAAREAERAIAVELVVGLPPALREVCELVYLQGLTREQAAATLGIGLVALKSRIRRARALLAARAAVPGSVAL